MKSSLKKDIDRRILFKLFEFRRRCLKSILYNEKVILRIRLSAIRALSLISRNISHVRIRNRCSLTGRSSGLIRNYKISRIEFRRRILSGSITGLIKGDW